MIPSLRNVDFSAKRVRCAPGSDEDCAGSAGCAENGLCSDVGAICLAADVLHCEGATKCQREGKCRLDNGLCVPDDASCAASSDCALLGRCTYNGAQKFCVVFDDADCAQASACTMDGACTAVMSCHPEDSACSLYGS